MPRLTPDPHSYARPTEVVVRRMALDLDVDLDRQRLAGSVTFDVERVDPEATELALDCCSPPLKSRLEVVPKQLESGDKLSQALAKTGVIPELGLWAIERREQTESLRLEEIGALLGRELALNVNRGLVLFEPIIFLGVVVVISLFIGAILVPLYQLLGNLG